MNKRNWIIVGTAVPVLAFIALLAWASFKSGGNPGGLGVNDDFGQVVVEEEVAWEFTLELLGGPVPSGPLPDESLSLSELSGKVVLLDFWASWCGPCQQEAQTLTRVYQEYRDKKVEFVGIDIWDGRLDALNHIERFGVLYPNGIDSEGTIAINYGVKGIPEKVFIDPEGMVVKKFVGPISAQNLRAVLDELLGVADGISPSP